MNNKRGNTGFTTRIIASFITVISLPFIIVNPVNPVAIISFTFGNFLLVLGGLLP